MENKTTTELIDLLKKLIGKEGNLKEGWGEAFEELKSREPFYSIMNEESDEGLPALQKRIEDLEADVKKLKRHKHDEKTGDVLIRIQLIIAPALSS